MHIVASRPQDLQVAEEPTYNLTMGRWLYDTAAVRRQLGATKKQTPPGDRDVMSIIADDMEKSIFEAAHATRNRADKDIWEDLWFLTSTRSYVVDFCPTTWCTSTNEQVDVIYADLFNTIINDTDSPARALQAVNFMMARMAYYDMLPSFTPERNETATIRTMQPTVVPTRRRGYWAVMGILGAFHILFVVICVLFTTTNFSLPDNAWHTIAQMSESAEISGILSRAKVMTDSEVKATSKESQDDEEDRFVVRNGAFVRASFLSDAAAEDPENLSNASRIRRRFMVGRGLDK
ncbi:hypothetical protein K4K57_005334 [Colletotrichum sp. SAR 10_99]|nr:hypothetical protein K4K57_005334 [Colletotrichum sp. SAR 10_99]